MPVAASTPADAFGTPTSNSSRCSPQQRRRHFLEHVRCASPPPAAVAVPFSPLSSTQIKHAAAATARQQQQFQHLKSAPLSHELPTPKDAISPIHPSLRSLDHAVTGTRQQSAVLTVRQSDLESLLCTLRQLDPRGDHAFVEQFAQELAVQGGTTTLQRMRTDARMAGEREKGEQEEEVAFSQTQLSLQRTPRSATAPVLSADEVDEVAFSQTQGVAMPWSAKRPTGAAEAETDNVGYDPSSPLGMLEEFERMQLRALTPSPPHSPDDDLSQALSASPFASPPVGSNTSRKHTSQQLHPASPAAAATAGAPGSAAQRSSRLPTPAFVNPFANRDLLELLESQAPPLQSSPLSDLSSNRSHPAASPARSSAPLFASVHAAAAASAAAAAAAAEDVVDEGEGGQPFSPSLSQQQEGNEEEAEEAECAADNSSSHEYSLTPPARRQAGAAAHAPVSSPLQTPPSSQLSLSLQFGPEHDEVVVQSPRSQRLPVHAALVPPTFAAPTAQLTPARTSPMTQRRAEEVKEQEEEEEDDASDRSFAFRQRSAAYSPSSSSTPPLTQLSSCSSPSTVSSASWRRRPAGDDGQQGQEFFFDGGEHAYEEADDSRAHDVSLLLTSKESQEAEEADEFEQLRRLQALELTEAHSGDAVAIAHAASSQARTERQTSPIAHESEELYDDEEDEQPQQEEDPSLGSLSSAQPQQQQQQQLAADGWRSKLGAKTNAATAGPSALTNPSAMDASSSVLPPARKPKPFELVRSGSGSAASSVGIRRPLPSDAVSGTGEEDDDGVDGASSSSAMSSELPQWKRSKVQRATDPVKDEEDVHQPLIEGGEDFFEVQEVCADPGRHSAAGNSMRANNSSSKTSRLRAPAALAAVVTVAAPVVRPARRRSVIPVVDPVLPASAVSQAKPNKNSRIAPLTLTNYLRAPSRIRSPLAPSVAKREPAASARASLSSSSSQSDRDSIDLTSSPERGAAPASARSSLDKQAAVRSPSRIPVYSPFKRAQQAASKARNSLTVVL
jgi:hypothetical protein